jgi:hypothetical protein
MHSNALLLKHAYPSWFLFECLFLYFSFIRWFDAKDILKYYKLNNKERYLADLLKVNISTHAYIWESR